MTISEENYINNQWFKFTFLIEKIHKAEDHLNFNTILLKFKY